MKFLTLSKLLLRKTETIHYLSLTIERHATTTNEKILSTFTYIQPRQKICITTLTRREQDVCPNPRQIGPADHESISTATLTELVVGRLVFVINFSQPEGHA